MLEDYIKFDVKAYIKDSQKRELKRQKLQSAYDNIRLISSGSIVTGSNSSNVSHRTEDAALRLAAISEKIDKLDAETRLFNTAFDMLSDRQKCVLSEFFYSGKSKGEVTDKIAQTFHISPKQVYNIRGQAIDDLSSNILSLLS